jgi:ABC-type Fe3+/spermidine/putrescine transport system ATPase subunit
MSATVELVGLTKAFQRHGSASLAQNVVDNIDLKIEAGEFVSLLGSSGCGKTTTLRLIAGLESPDSGKILINGEDVTDVPPSHRDTRMVFQDYALFPNMTVAENVAFGMTLRQARNRFPPHDMNRRVQQYLAIVRLDNLGERKPHQLSGGQRQRVALARALVTDPAIVLFDEPLGALDAGLRREMQFELKRIHAEFGKTFIYVTHDQEEALAMSDRIAVMKDGKIQQYSAPEDLYERPETAFVAKFIGATNILDVELLDRIEGLARVKTKGGAILSGIASASLGTGPAAGMMIRADRLNVEKLGATRDGSALSGRIKERLFLGTRNEFLVALDGGGEMVVHRPANERIDFATEEQVVLHANSGDVRILAS